ncbi:MAG TPA: PfkB family carbohydrate kinase [Pirellulales bacterium]|jgi:rfaE bifunctional protein kinase chain/domain|nr:PfkB family carbohydrate kinase [Pirellulales bacterium]
MISLARLESILSGLSRLTIGLVGDLFLDRYLDLDPALEETSIETGLEAYQVTRVRNSPGALGTVMNNLAALGVGRLVPVTILGDDGQAYDLVKELQKMPVDVGHIVRDPARLTPTYTKPMRRDAAGSWHELNRIDLRNNAPPGRETEGKLIDQLSEVFDRVDGLIVLDQVNEDEWGVITTGVRERLASLCRANPGKTVLVDSRRRIGLFCFGMLKPNVAECRKALAAEKDSTAIPAAAPGEMAVDSSAAQELSLHTGRPLFCTVGESGMLLVGFSPSVEHVPGFPVSGPIDVVGAGDSATAGIVSALLSGATPGEAATLGNLVASITVQQIGTTGTASPAQVVARWKQVFETKI